MRFCLLPKLAASAAWAQSSTWPLEFANHNSVQPNITYVTSNSFESKVDLYKRRNATTPQPTAIYIYCGGWTGGTKLFGTITEVKGETAETRQ